MKFADIQRLHAAGLISEDQRQKIVEHFGLKEEGGKMLAILSMFGALLIAGGVALLISAHWDEIPRGVKIFGGLILMLGAHGLGWWLREGRLQYRKIGEAMHLLGSCLFLANIALLGQIYNLSSRPPNAFLIWWLGIAALPWLLRSKAQHVLLLVAITIWFGFEANQADSWLYCNSTRQALLYSVLGIIYVGAGWILRHGKFAEFAPVTEGLGLLLFLATAFPLAWKDFFERVNWTNINRSSLPTLAIIAVLAMAVGARNLTTLNRQWRWTWFAALVGMLGVMMAAWFGFWKLSSPNQFFFEGPSWGYVPGALALFIFCLLQVQVGIQERSALLVNVGVIFIALDIIAAYFDLFGSMARTGLMFVIGGVLLIGLGIFLEKRRRALVRRLQLST